MKKNISVLLMIIVMLLSTILFTNKVDAVVMYLECYVNKECESTYDFLYWYCLPTLNTFAAVTSNNGSVDYYIFDKAFYGYYLFEDDDYCWLSGDFKNISNSCDDDTMYDEKYAEILNAGYCPLGVRTQKLKAFNIPSSSKINWGYYEYVPVGKTKEHVDMEVLENAEFIIYSFVDNDGNEKKVAEGYNSNGAYCYAGPDIKKSFKDEIKMYQRNLIKNVGGDYFKVATNFESLLVSGSGKEDGVSLGGTAYCTNGKDDCIENHEFKVIIDSNDSNNNIYNAIEDWYDISGGALSHYSNLLEVINNEQFTNTCSELNASVSEGHNYSFGEYNVQNLINDLERLFNALEIAYEEGSTFIDFATNEASMNDAVSSAASYIYTNLVEIYDLHDIAYADDEENYLNINSLNNAIVRYIEKRLEDYLDFGDYEINIVNVSRNLSEYVLKYYTTVLNLITNSDRFAIKKVDYNRLITLKEKFADLIEREELNIYPIVDCKSLIGDELLDKINSYLNIIKIAIPILLIGLGILDFTKAIFSGDEDSMKKAQKTFIKRLAISILIFLTPTIVNLILQLANKVWLNISPNACGLFE